MTESLLWNDRRKKAGWALDTTGMAKSGYAPKKADLARWVTEAADEIERLNGTLDRLAAYVQALRVGQKTNEGRALTKNEMFALHGQNTVLEMVEGVLNGR